MAVAGDASGAASMKRQCWKISGVGWDASMSAMAFGEIEHAASEETFLVQDVLF